MLAIDAKVAGFKSEQLTNEVGLKQELRDLDNTALQALNEREIAEAMLYLISAKWTTGAIVDVDGGLGLGLTHE